MKTLINTMAGQGNAKNKLVVGMTGGIGSGKTAASDWFAKQGVDVIDADVIAHQIVTKNSPTLQKIADKFGDWVLDKNAELDRKAMREHVFNHSSALIDLEAITHPAIREQAKQQLEQANSAYVLLSAPLLLEASEAGLVNLCQRILVIDAPESVQVARASQRDGLSAQKIESIMENQLSREARREQADDMVVNDGTLEALYAKLKPLHEQYLQMAQTV